jgi:hypothetical protein
VAKKTSNGTRQQIGVRLSSDDVSLLSALQQFYADRAGLSAPLSQSDAVGIMLRETAKTHKLKGGR